MKKKTTLSEEDQALFRQLMAGTRKIKQDTIVHRPQRKKISEVPVKRLIQEQADASHYFSDEFQPLLNTEMFARMSAILKRRNCGAVIIPRSCFLICTV